MKIRWSGQGGLVREKERKTDDSTGGLPVPAPPKLKESRTAG